MSDNLANQEKSVKKAKKMDTVKVSSAKSTSSQETVRSTEKSADIGDDDRRKERERHNSGASSTHSLPVYPRTTWTNSSRYQKYRGSSENRRGPANTYSNRESVAAPPSIEDETLHRHTSTQSLNSNASKKVEEETVETAASSTSTDAANDIRRIAVNSPETEEGNVTYIAAGTAPASRIGTLRQNATGAAFSAYAGPAPKWEGQRGERGTGGRGPFPPSVGHSPPTYKQRGEEQQRFYEKRDEPVRRDLRPSPESNRLMGRRVGGGFVKRTGDRQSMSEVDGGMDRESSTPFFHQQNDENCRNTLASLTALSQMQQQLAEGQGMNGHSLPRYYGDWRMRGGEQRQVSEGEKEHEGMQQQPVPATEEEVLYPTATSIVCGMDGREKKRDENADNTQDLSSQHSTPNEKNLVFSNASGSTSSSVMVDMKRAVEEMDGSSSINHFHQGVPTMMINERSPLDHRHSPSMDGLLVPPGGAPLTPISAPIPPTTVSTSTPPPTVSSALPSSMVAHPQRSYESLRSSSASHLHHPLPPPPIHSSIHSSLSSPMLIHHSHPQRNGYGQPTMVMDQSEDCGSRMTLNGGMNGHRQEETRSYLSAAHPTVWSSAAAAATGTPTESGGSLPPRAPPSGFVDEGGRYTISEMDYLSEEIWHYHNTMTQTESTLSRKLHLRDMLYYAICPVFPMCGLYVVGSSLNGFGNNSSDMDLCLMITNKDLDQKTDAVVVLNMILNQLENVEWVAQQQLIVAKVPILRIQFTAPFGDITVDLNANNSVAIKNTHLLCYYSTFDWRVRPLVTIVKEWAKKKGINDANRSSFTSYSLVLMVIHYLQCGVDHPVVPSLQSLYVRRFSRTADVRSLNVSIPLPHPPEEWSFNDTSTLGELLIGFLEYFAEKFNYDQHAISVRMGKKLNRTEVVRIRGQYNQPTNNWRSQWRCVCIEEPFTYSNTAHSVYDEMVFTAIKDAFREAYHELESTRDLRKLLNCTPINVPNLHGNGAVVYLTGSVGADTSAVASSSSSSLSTPHSGHASSASSSCGDEEEKRDTASPPSPSCASPSPSSCPPPPLSRTLKDTGGGGGIPSNTASHHNKQRSRPQMQSIPTCNQ
ncbi:hypothetical protein PFISCL1PPCAC_19597 [Pristionchus fissidentatus]|uniref:polynucleotide adenylyltransferase n=1 Tax=Pristionchus fissidentatus TaxID=1538716 RepID=A0AAV5WCG2_9BILA|nr:hypothetical protein PFISCL1PPCAC_19597 [Pristionchus fissidentatus]